MPIDKEHIDPVVASLRKKLKRLEEKEITGENFEKMAETINTIEKLAEKLNDLDSFNSQMMSKGYYGKCMQYYSDALSEYVRQQDLAKNNDTLPINTSETNEVSIIQLQQNDESDKKKHNNPVQMVIDIDKSGVSFPEFLDIIEANSPINDIDDTAIIRDEILKDIKYADDFYLPIHKEMYKRMLEYFDELSSKTNSGKPDSFEYELGQQKIEWEFTPKIYKRKMIIEHWNKLIDCVYDWLDSFCSFASNDERWKTPGASEEIIKKNIKRTQIMTPYYLAVREKTFFDYFSLKWDDIWTHETFLNEKKANRIFYSDNRIELIQKTYLQLKPQNKPGDDLIKLCEEMYANKTNLNPNYKNELY